MYGDNKSFGKISHKNLQVLATEIYGDNKNFGKISHKNLQVLATEIYKFKHELSPQIKNNVFELKSVPNMRRQDLFRSRNVHSVRHGTDSFTYLGPKIWDIVPQVIKNSKLLSVFKTKIKQWVPINCPCTLCRPYSQYVGYI